MPKLDERDIRIDTFRPAMPISAIPALVRATHIPSGLVAQCSDYTGMLRNRKWAIDRLTALVEAKLPAGVEAAQ